MKFHSVMIHGQVTIINTRTPLLVPGPKEKELPQLAVEIPAHAFPMSERKWAETISRIGYQMMEQARAAGLIRP